MCYCMHTNVTSNARNVSQCRVCVNEYLCVLVTGDTCKTPLGMQSETIPDSAITASSSYDPDSVGPTRARSTACLRHSFIAIPISLRPTFS